MPRPRKWKKVCCMPNTNLYGPLEQKRMNEESVTLTIEEYETIRLIDLEGFTQEEAAKQMNAARTTIQRIYNEARKKIAQSIVDGITMKIEGGEYLLCDGLEKMCGCGGCNRHRVRKQESEKKYNKMKEEEEDK
jgi:predicted DNA-binding protein (UPF0251 family)